MNLDQPSREQIEARITALLLGELPAAEAELLRWSISRDAELKKLHDQLKVTIGFVSEAMKNPTGAPMEREAPLKLSQERRQVLLTHFKTARPQTSFWLRRIEIQPLIPTLVVIAIIVLLAAVLLPVVNSSKTRGFHASLTQSLSTSQESGSINNTRQIQASVNEWNLETGQAKKLPPSADAQKAVTVNFQTTQPTPIVLPSTEMSQIGSGQNAGSEIYSQSVVGFVNLYTNASMSSVPNQLDTKTASTAESQLPAGYVTVNDGRPVPVVEVSPGGSSPMPSQQEPQTTPVTVTPIAESAPPIMPPTAPSAMEPDSTTPSSDLPKGEFPSTSAEGNYTMAPVPQPLPTISSQLGTPTELPESAGGETTVNGNNSDGGVAGNRTGGFVLLGPLNDRAGNVAENSANKPQNGTTGVPTEYTNEVIPLKYAKADEIAKTLSSLGGVGGGTVSFGSATTAGTTGSRNGFNGSEDQRVSGVVTPNPGVSAITPTYYVTNGTVYVTGYTFKDGGTDQSYSALISSTNFIAGNQGAFYRVINNSGGGSFGFQGQAGESSALATREIQNANTIGETSSSIGIMNPATGLPENAPSGTVPALAPPPNTEIADRERVSLPPQNNLADNEMIPPGLIDFQGADASQVLEVYAQLTGRTLLRADLPKAQIVLKTESRLTRAEAIQILQRVLALHGIAVINVGDKFMKAVPASQAGMAAAQADKPLSAPMIPAPVPQPEILTRDNAFSTFSLNVSDVSFKLAAASLEKGQMPAPDSIRSEEFINAFDYRDPEPLQGQPLAFRFERAQDPFAQERDLLRFSIKAAAAGRPDGRALNLVLLLDTSGSMERADRVAIIREALRVLASQLQPQDTVSVVTFARTARLWADGVPGDQAGATLDKVGSITPEGGTNLEEAMRLAYETARRHFLANGMNRVVLLTDGAANLGNVDPQALTQRVETERRQGIALDCFGIGWEDYNDDLLEQLSSNGDGRYAFINSPDEAATEFAAKLAGALQVAAEDVKVQVEFNPDRVTAWRQIGYAKHQLTKQQFRDNTVAAGAIAAREAGNALYVIETKPDGEGPIATVRVRYRVPGTQDNRERSWLVEYAGAAAALAQSSSAMRLVTTAAETSEWLADSPFAQNVTPDELLNYLSGVPQFYGADERPKQLEWMIRQAKSVSGK